MSKISIKFKAKFLSFGWVNTQLSVEKLDPATIPMFINSTSRKNFWPPTLNSVMSSVNSTSHPNILQNTVLETSSKTLILSQLREINLTTFSNWKSQ